MKLLHSEIDVVPGRKPLKQPLAEGFVGTGVGTLRITNGTARQNSYSIRVICEQAFWQDAWYSLSAVAPTGGPENVPPSGKPDQPGPKNQSLTLFIRDGGTRDVLISLFVPEKSECRAGVYKARVVVETRVLSDDPHTARNERITEIPVSIIVRPFHKWEIAFTPEERRVGLFKRRSDFELIVTNQGNDWLYCDLTLPRPQNVMVETMVQRVAVPPPEPGTDSVRTVPVTAVTRMRTVRGPRTPTALPLTVQRVDAPSVPPLPEEALYGPSSANLGAAVVAVDTDEVGTPEVPAKVLYCPPVPDTFTAFIEAIVRNARGLVFAVIGAILAWQLAVFTYEVYWKSISDVRVSRSTIKVGEPFRIKGKNLVGSQILLYDPATKAQIGEPLAPKVEPKSLLQDYVVVTIKDPDLNNRKVVIGAQRLGKLTFFNRFLPIVKDPTPVLIGQEVVKVGPPSGSVTANVAPGQNLTIGGVNFGATPGKVLIDGKGAKVLSWSDDSIGAVVPKDKLLGDTFSVAAFTADGTSIPISPPTVTIKLPGSNDTPPDQEPVIGPDGELIPPGGTTGGGGRNEPPDPPVEPDRQDPPVEETGSLPPAYERLLSDKRADYTKAVEETRRLKSSGGLAVQAYALAALNRDDEAKTAVRKALTLIGERSTGKDYAVCLLTLAKIVENVNPANAGAAYAKADAQVDAAAPGFAFKDLVIARSKVAANSDFEAKIVLQDALKKSPSGAERSAIQQMLNKVAR